MRWQGLLGAVAPSAGAVALLELSRLPADAHRGEAGRLLAALAQLARSAMSELALPALLLAVTAGVLFSVERARGRGERAPKALLVALVALAIAQSALAREVLIEHHPFSWNPVSNAGFVAVAIGITGVHLALAASKLPRIALGAGIAMMTVSLAAVRMHYAILVGQYPTLHACVVHLAFVGLCLGAALTLSVLARDAELRSQAAVRPIRARRAAIALGALCGLGLGVLAVLELPSSAWARPAVMAYTELGRAAGVAEALDRDRARLLPSDLPAPRDPHGILRPDPHAAWRFARRAGLPPLELDLPDVDVLLVLSDATRHDRTSLARAGGPTPHLAALADRGAHVFTRANAPSNGTFTSVAAMLAMAPVSFTELDVLPRFWRGRLRDERTTAIEAMRDAGRATFWVGHDHEGCFSHNVEGLEQGFDARELVPETRGDPSDADVDARIAELAIARIRAHRRAHERYFGLVFFVSPHDDYRAHGPDTIEPLDRYDAELTAMDAALGRVLDALAEDGGMRDTVVVFVGDHGEAFGEHGEEHHLGSMHEEQIHVPFVVWVPGERGERHTAPTSTAYLFPWLLSRGTPSEREVASRALTQDIGPMMRALDGAVLSEVIGPRRQEAALAWEDTTVVYDVLADLARVYDAHGDPMQQRDLREERPDLYAPVTSLVRRYRRARFEGRRFRFLEPMDDR
jgi:arylsulfatase A-like enzyme